MSGERPPDGLYVRFPEGSVPCAAGDYLVCRGDGGRWSVYRVEDLLLVKRLRPALSDPSTLMIEEHLLDSMIPAYADEVQLLLTSFDPEFTDRSDALRAIRAGTPSERERGLLRSARGFSSDACGAVRL